MTGAGAMKPLPRRQAPSNVCEIPANNHYNDEQDDDVDNDDNDDNFVIDEYFFFRGGRA